jgi:sugar/nucleoside kinase (ribokinase family)
LGVGDRFCSDVELFKKVYKKTFYRYCSITHGGNGAKLSTKYNIFHAPALTKKFIDTLGAGDAYFAISSLFVINRQDPELILLSGNIAGSLKISYLGHEKYLNKDRFYSYFKSLIS